MPFTLAEMQWKLARGHGASAVFCRRRVPLFTIESRDCSKQLTLAHCVFPTDRYPYSEFAHVRAFLASQHEIGASPLHGEGPGELPGEAIPSGNQRNLVRVWSVSAYPKHTIVLLITLHSPSL